jgi:hypothetical protein
MDIQKLASSTYKKIPSAGFSWHQAEMGRSVLEDIRDHAQLTGDEKALALSRAALRTASRNYPSDLDGARVLAYSAALATLGGGMNAPVSVLLAHTGLDAMSRHSHPGIQAVAANGFLTELIERGEVPKNLPDALGNVGMNYSGDFAWLERAIYKMTGEEPLPWKQSPELKAFALGESSGQQFLQGQSDHAEGKHPTPQGYQTAFYAVGGAPGVFQRAKNSLRDRYLGHR